MRRLALAALLLSTLALGGCSFVAPVIPPTGMIFSDIQAPIDTDAAASRVGSKSGRSKSISILGLVAVGDASVTTAARNGDISEIHHVDYEYMNILFLYQEFSTRVYGE